MAQSLLQLAGDALKRGRAEEAQRHLAIALEKNAHDHAALALLGEAWLLRKDVLNAAAYYILAINASPRARQYQERFLELAGDMRAAGYDETYAKALLACFATPGLDCARVARLWLSLLFAEPKFDAAFGLARRKAFARENGEAFERIADFRPLLMPLFLEGISKIVPYDALFEEFIAHVRRHLLGDFGLSRKFKPHELIALAAALSHYAFATDFILDRTDEERANVDKLQARIESDPGMAGNETAIALLACYRPLTALSNAREILARFAASKALSEVVKTQIADVLELREMAAKIPALTQIGGGVTAQVREQYESFPYPKWTHLSKERILADWKKSPANRRIEGPLRGKSADILVAGCGTGREAAIVAAIFPDAKITAIDLSRTSLAYAAAKAKEHGLANIAFKHGDILDLDRLDTKFDYISSTGVLHHLKDPMEGWKMFCRVLKPGGLMRVGLYAEKGREAIVAAREAIAKGNYSADRDGMLRFRREWPCQCSGEMLRELTNFGDYYHLNTYRDLLFHVQEHRFDLPRIGQALKQLGLSFAGFYLPAEVGRQYAETFPGDPEGTSFKNWTRFERLHPAPFKNMYVFWACAPA